MSNTTIQLKKSGLTGNTPADLVHGELAINYADGKLFYKNGVGIKAIENQKTFSTINSNNSLIIASTPTDILSLVAGNNIVINTNTISKSITIGFSGSTLIDSYARDTANSASSNTVYILGIDYAQNNRIDAAYAAANISNSFVNSGGTVTGNVNITGSLTIGEDFIVEGNTTYTNISAIKVDNPIIFLANNNVLGDALDIGFVGLYNNGANSYTGLFRDPTLKEYFLFKDYTQPVEANTLIDINDSSFVKANLIAQYIKANLISDKATVGGVNILDFINRVSSNTIVTQGVDNTQNNRIDTIHAVANVGSDFVNNGGVIGGDVFISQDLTVTGNLSVLGSEVKLNTASIDINSSFLLLANNNTFNDILDFGFAGTYNDGDVRHAGLFRDPTVKEFLFFDGYTPNIASNTLIDINDSSFSRANVQVDYVKGNLIASTVTLNGTDLTGKLDSLTSNTIYSQEVDNWQNTSITSVDSFAQSAYDKSNSANVLAQAAFNKANNTSIRVGTTGVDNVISNVITNVTGINFDTLTGFSVSDLGSGNVKVSLGSTFKTWKVDGQTDLIAVAEDTVRFGAANGITITTDPAGDPKSITFSAYPVYSLANTASANTIYTQGVDATQNTNIEASNNLAQGAFDKANNALPLTGGTVAGNITANNFTANLAVYTPNLYSPGSGALIEMSDIGIISINPSGGSGAGPKFIGKTIEVNQVYSGSYGGNYLSLNNETRLGSNRYDSVQIVTGTDGNETNIWNFSNNQLIFPDNTYQNTAFTGTAIDQYGRNQANAANNLATSSYAQANAANNLAQSSFNLANTNASSITVIQGVDTTQNTNISAADTLARGAFNQANAATNSASYAYGRANSAYTQANVGATFVSSGGTVSGNVVISKDLSVTGNLYVLGNTVSINTSSFTVQDSLIILGLGNYTTDILDIGFAGHYNDGVNAHAGIIRDSTNKEFYIFQGYTPELDATNNIDINDPSFATANVNASYFKGNLIATTAVIGGYDIFNYSYDGYAQANAATNSAQAAFNQANAANNLATSSYAQANAADTMAIGAYGVANTNATNIAIIQGVNNTQNTNISAADTLARGAFGQANATNTYAFSAYTQANATNNLASSAYNQANAADTLASSAYQSGNTNATNITNVNIFATSGYAQANAANNLATSAYNTANLKFNTSGGTITGSVNVNANLIVTGANVSLGNVGNVHIYGGNTGQLLSTDNFGKLEWIDLPTPNTVTYTANSLIQTNGVYVSGNLWSTQVFGDYGSANGAYVLTDGSGTAPAWYIDFDFLNVVKFNRVVMNINYSQNSGHTIYVQLYNNTTSTWDNIGTYTGLGSYYAFALEVIDEASYLNSGRVQLRLYHSNAGNVSHQTSIDYIALEQSYQGPQGPRGPTGATGATGATGNGVSSGGTTGQVLIKTSATDYATAWSNNLIDAWNSGNASYIQANSANNMAIGAYGVANTNSNLITIIQGVDTTQNTNISAANNLAQGAFNKANTVGTLAQAAFDKANTGTSGGSTDKTYTFYQNSAPATSNAHDLWVNSDTGVVYENFGSNTSPVWAEFGPTGVATNTAPGIISATNLNINYTPATTTGYGLSISAANTQGGTGYADFLKVTNTTSGATNPNKSLRMNSTGSIEIINSAYTSTLMLLSDAGAMSVSGSYQVNGKQAVNGPAFRAYIDSGQAITSGSQQKVTFGSETFDTNGNFSSSRFTPTVEGYYQLNATVRIEGNSGTGEVMITIWKNGSEYARGTNEGGTEQGANWYSLQVSDLAYANGTGDYFEIYIQQTSGGNRNTTAGTNISYFSGSMVRGA